MASDPLEALTHGLFDTTSLSAHTQAMLAAQPLHPRTAILTAIVERLRVEMLAPERVLDSPPDPIDDDRVPVLCVYTIDEPVEILDMAPRRLVRDLEPAVHRITAPARPARRGARARARHVRSPRRDDRHLAPLPRGACA